MPRHMNARCIGCGRPHIAKTPDDDLCDACSARFTAHVPAQMPRIVAGWIRARVQAAAIRRAP